MLASENSTSEETLFLQPPPHQRYIRSFLFSRRIDAPFARAHLIARVLLVLSLSGLLLRTIDTTHPDLVGASLLFLASILLFILSGIHARRARLYLLLTLSSLISLFTTWILFNPVVGHVVLLQFPVYSGQLRVGLAFWELLWVLIVGIYFFTTHKLLIGILVATVVAFLVAHFLLLPSWPLFHITFFHPLKVYITDRGLLVASTKVIGYTGMAFATIALVVTSRDIELIGALRQLHVPPAVIFFLSTVFRSLDLALSDYTIISQAQLARAVNARPRSILRRLSDLGSIAVPLVATMIRRSSEIGDALQIRGYVLGRPNADFYETSPWHWLDWIIVLISFGLLIIAFAPHDTLTHLLGWW